MDTPVADFVRAYAQKDGVRLHMPGHKGKPILGPEPMDITEIQGADALYEASGIIAQSEANATALFGTRMTCYSTEGASQCIRAMVRLAASRGRGGRPWFLAARNAHKAFLYALALEDADVQWLWPESSDTLCSCLITARQVEDALLQAKTPPVAVYVTSPDYLGQEQPLEEIARVCHKYGTLLLVDNAHGAYLRFLPQSRHPMDLGTDLCCDSAHKTLPVLTGGAYLHISDRVKDLAGRAKDALALFGSTSPSYLTLASLDLCNASLSGEYTVQLQNTMAMVEELKDRLRSQHWDVLETEPMKLTLRCDGLAVSSALEKANIYCEFADRDYLVCMISVQTTREELNRLAEVLGENTRGNRAVSLLSWTRPTCAMTVRQAVYAPQETIPVAEALGRICASPAVSCPPAIPIAVSGEVLDQHTLDIFRYYGVEQVTVVK